MRKNWFSFSCPYPREEVIDRLREQIGLLEDREYLLEVTNRGFDLGIGRAGHQGGDWYLAEVVPGGDGCRISGRVVRRHWDGTIYEESRVDKLEYILFIVLLFPLFLIIRFYQLFHPLVTNETMFVEFMTTKMECTLI